MNKSLNSTVKVLIIVFAGMLGGYFIYSAQNSLRQDEQAFFAQSRIGFEEAMAQESDKHQSQMFAGYDAKTATRSMNDAFDWFIQNVSIGEDSCRHYLDNVFQAKLAQAGYLTHTAIYYTKQGHTTVSKPNVNLSQMHLVASKTFIQENDTIQLRAYADRPASLVIWKRYEFLIGLGMMMGSVSIGAMLVYWAWKRQRLATVLPKSEVVVLEPNPLESEEPEELEESEKLEELEKSEEPEEPEQSISCPPGEHIIGSYYWEARVGKLFFQEKSIILNGMAEKYFNLAMASKDLTILYKDLLLLYSETELTKSVRDKIQHTISLMKSNFESASIPIVFESIRGKGYQLKFNEENNSAPDDHYPG